MEKMAEGQGCPRCGVTNVKMTSVTVGLKLALEGTGQQHQLPNLVCTNCYNELTSYVSQGMKLKLEQEARDKNKLILWKSRTHLIKQARVLMSHRAYAEAAIFYEKYLRVLEIVHNLEKGELSPQVFNNSNRSKELTIVASTYWDLMRIYDTSPRFLDRMVLAAKKLSQFLPLSPIYSDVIKRADIFVKTAHNPQVVHEFLKSSKISRMGCFIATEVFENKDHPTVEILRQFRDQIIILSAPGRHFVLWYYQWGPYIAERLKSRNWTKVVLRLGFRLIAVVIKKSLKSKPVSVKS
ncbi:MAG: hypothetical protein K1X29_06725 [Bdellovibrionales bacterium]|nr:hypothetical protein [Bdellovibrionales bacterium]